MTQARNLSQTPTMLDIATGNIPGKSVIHKFGDAPDFDTGDNEVDVWDGANDGGPNLMTHTYSSSADIDSLSSSSGSDTGSIFVTGLDTNFDFVEQTITLTGQTRKALSTALIRVFRMENHGSSNFVGTIYCYVDVALTAGVPNTLGNIRALVTIGNNQTAMALYTVPNGKKVYMVSFNASTEGAQKTSNYAIRLLHRDVGGVFELDEAHALVESGTSHFNHKFTVPKQFLAKTDLKMTAQITAGAVTGASVGCGFELVIVDD